MNMDLKYRGLPAVAGAVRDANDYDGIAIGDLVMALRRHVGLIAICVVLISAVGVALYKVQKPIYSSTARVLVQTEQLGTPSFLSGIAAYRESQYAEPVNRKIETEIALILSRSNAVKVITALEIGESDLPSSPLKIVARSVSGFIARMRGKPEKESGSVAGSAPTSEFIDDYLATISIDAVRSKTAETTSNVLEIRVDSANVDDAPRALGAMLDSYLEVGALQSQRLGHATIGKLSTQIADAQSELGKIEQAIIDLSVLESSRTDLAAAATSAAAIQSGGRRDGSSFANDGAVSQLVVQMLQLQGQLAELRETYTDDTESVRKLKQRVADSRNRLASHMRASATTSAEFSKLERQRALAQEHYGELRRKLDQIELFMQLTPTALNGRVVVDAPSIPVEDDVKKKKVVLLLAPVAGLLLGLFLASLIEFFQQRLRTRRDVERLLGLPFLGAIPKAKAGS